MAMAFDTPEGKYGFCENLEELACCPYELEWTKINGSTTLFYATKPKTITISKEKGIIVELPDLIPADLNYYQFCLPININKELFNKKLPYSLKYREIEIYDIAIHKNELKNFRIKSCPKFDFNKDVERLVTKMFTKNEESLKIANSLLDKFEKEGSFTLQLKY